MSGKMNIYRLTQNELNYELSVRGIAIGTVDEMRKNLNRAMKLEETGNSFTVPQYPYTYEEDKRAVEEKLTEITDLLNKFEDNRSSASFVKIESKLFHVMGRINRMKAETDKELEIKSKLLASVLNGMSELEDKAEKFSKKRVDVPPALSILESPTIDLPGPSRGQSTPIEIPRTYIKPVPVNKWDVKFSGDKKGLSVNAFIQRVQELCGARNVSEDVLFNSAIDLFSGKALCWYRDARKYVSSWGELVEQLRVEFQPADYNEKLLDEIRHRTQGADETIGIYLAIMSSLFERLTCSISEEAKLKILLRNIAPFYQSQLGLVEVKTIAQLRDLCRRLEAKRESVEAFQPPPRRAIALEPDLAYVGVNEDVDRVAVAELKSTQHNTSEFLCFNCGKPGHKAAGCLEKRRRICYGCKKEGYTKRTCPDCNKGSSGNARRRF